MMSELAIYTNSDTKCIILPWTPNTIYKMNIKSNKNIKQILTWNL